VIPSKLPGSGHKRFEMWPLTACFRAWLSDTATNTGFRSGSNPLLRHTGVVLWSFLWTNLSLGDLRPPIFGHRSAVTRKALRLACALSALQRFN